MARVLIVDDEEADRLLLRSILERAGHQVLEATDGAEALEEYGSGAIDVVVTDLQMRNVHGLEFIAILRDLQPRPGIIAISGTGEAQLDMAHAMGASKTLTKPVIPDQLLSAMDEVLGGAMAGPETGHPA